MVVWLFTRPLSLFPRFGIGSNGTLALRHLGVLVSELTFLDVHVIMHTQDSTRRETSLDTMYQLFREEGYSNVNIIRNFGTATIRQEWHGFSAEYIGTTEMAFDMIDREGIIHQFSFYSLSRQTDL